MTNQAEFSFREIIDYIDFIDFFSVEDTFKFKGVSTDTRNISEGNLFIALTGENFDGNALAVSAIEKGAFAAIISKSYYINHKDDFLNMPVIIVDNTLKALGQIANLHRKRFLYPIIAIGGSNGKTTTKEMVANVLGRKYRVLKTEGNYNNQIGVPLTLLRLNNDYNLAVIEIGTNEPGEIEIISGIVEPDFGLITNIGREHLERLIDLDGVEMEETFLFGYLRKHNKTAFINMDDERLRRYTPLLEKRVCYGLSESADFNPNLSFNENVNPIIDFTHNGNEYSIEMKSTGYASGLNAVAALTVGLHLDVSPDDVVESLSSFEPDTSHKYGRMVVKILSGVTILNDCYNANPDSMAVSLKTLSMMNPGGRKIAVMGDMRELGESGPTEHINILTLALSLSDICLITGSEMLKAYKFLNNERLHWFSLKEELTENLNQTILKGDAILIKGSRGMEMEKVVSSLELYLQNL